MISITANDLAKLNQYNKEVIMRDSISYNQFDNLKKRLGTKNKKIETFRSELEFGNYKPWSIAEVFLLGNVFNDSVYAKGFNEKYRAFEHLHRKYFPNIARTNEQVREKIKLINKNIGKPSDNSKSGYNLPLMDIIETLRENNLIGFHITRDRYEKGVLHIEVEGVIKKCRIRVTDIILEINNKIITNIAINNNIREIIEEIKDYEK